MVIGPYYISDSLMQIHLRTLGRLFRNIGIVGALWLVSSPTLLAQAESAESEELESIDEEENGESVRIFLNRRERREESRTYEIFENLEVATILDIEYGRERLSLTEEKGLHPTEDVWDESLEVELLGTPLPWLGIEIVYELTHEPGKWRSRFDEAFLTFLFEDWELEVGRLYMPLGEYNSFFASGPALEFGETRGRGGALSFEASDQWDFKVAGFKSDLDGNEAHTNKWDWSAAVEWSAHENFTMGVGYLSDLAEGVDSLLEDEKAYERRVEAWSVFALASLGSFEISSEYVAAMDAWAEFDPEFSRPKAWNVEVAYYTPLPVVIAGRWEGSRELEDEPEKRWGIAAIWGATDHLTVTFEVLLADYRPGFSEDTLEREVKRGREIAVAFSYEF